MRDPFCGRNDLWIGVRRLPVLDYVQAAVRRPQRTSQPRRARNPGHAASRLLIRRSMGATTLCHSIRNELLASSADGGRIPSNSLRRAVIELESDIRSYRAPGDARTSGCDDDREAAIILRALEKAQVSFGRSAPWFARMGESFPRPKQDRGAYCRRQGHACCMASRASRLKFTCIRSGRRSM